ncbi:MAG: 16S rRNA (uracil(1498)-N(3))-methyltransferase [Treponema sp.]|nr:16S rRNA (uracil(1498)-N(3))-methyltransferase [Treponema sp.]
MRQFIVDKNPDKAGLIYIDGKDFKYLRQVLRVKVGDMLYVRLLDGSLENTTVAKIDDKAKKITIQLCEKSGSITRGVQAEAIEQEVGNNGMEYWLFQFIPKPQKLEQIVRQATECGIKNIVPIIGEYSEKSSVEALSGSKKERLERVIKEARQQSGSPVETKIFEPVSLEAAVEMWNEAVELQLVEKNDLENHEKRDEIALGFVLSERADGCQSLSEIIEKSKIKKVEENQEKIQPENCAEQQIDELKKQICIVCGSEGGISPQEVELLVKKGLFYPIHFSVNILRCETAALYGIAAVQTAIN